MEREDDEACQQTGEHEPPVGDADRGSLAEQEITNDASAQAGHPREHEDPEEVQVGP